MGLIDGVELDLEPLEHVARPEERNGLGRERVHLRELVGELTRQRLARCGELRVANDPASDRLALDPLDHERLAAAHVVEVCVRPRHAHAGLVRSLEHAELVLEGERVGVDHTARGPPHEQRQLPVGGAHVDRPRLLRRSAGEQPQRPDLVCAEQRGQAFAQLVAPLAHHADWPPSTTSVWPVT